MLLKITLLLATARIFREFHNSLKKNHFSVKITMFGNCTIERNCLGKFSQICTKQKFNASTKTCFVKQVENTICAFYKTHNFIHGSHRI